MSARTAGAGAFAYLFDGEALGFAEADDEQAFGLGSVGSVEEEGLAECRFELTGEPMTLVTVTA